MRVGLGNALREVLFAKWHVLMLTMARAGHLAGAWKSPWPTWGHYAHTCPMCAMEYGPRAIVTYSDYLRGCWRQSPCVESARPSSTKWPAQTWPRPSAP